MPKKIREDNKLEQIASKATRWIGSVDSLIVHTLLFAAAFVLVFFGFSTNSVLLVLTTIVSLEAIYLAIFIQMSVNKATRDIEYIQEDVEDIQEDVDELQEDIEDIEEDLEEDEKEELARDKALMDTIENSLSELMHEIKELKEKHK